MQKVYFAASIRGGRDDRKKYSEIIHMLSQKYQVLTEHIGNDTLSQSGEADLSDYSIYERDISYIKESDFVVAECSTPSLGVGYELSYSEQLKKPVFVLFCESYGKKLSAMISGNSYFKVYNYMDDSQLHTILQDINLQIQ